MPRPPSTYDGRTSTGKPISRAIARASRKVLAAKPRGRATPSFSSTASNFSRSSARSSERRSLPTIAMPRALSWSARLIAVWPPKASITPRAFVARATASTSSAPGGSNTSTSETSKSVETVSGLLLMTTAARPASRSAQAACTHE